MTNDTRTLCWVCVIEPEEPFVFEVYGWATVEALSAAQKNLADDPIEDLPERTGAVLCKLVAGDELLTNWYFELVNPLKVKIIPPWDDEEATQRIGQAARDALDRMAKEMGLVS